MATEKAPCFRKVRQMSRSIWPNKAAESMLGPNPFIGLRLEDIVASFKAIGAAGSSRSEASDRTGGGSDSAI